MGARNRGVAGSAAHLGLSCGQDGSATAPPRVGRDEEGRRARTPRRWGLCGGLEELWASRGGGGGRWCGVGSNGPMVRSVSFDSFPFGLSVPVWKFRGRQVRILGFNWFVSKIWPCQNFGKPIHESLFDLLVCVWLRSRLGQSCSVLCLVQQT